MKYSWIVVLSLGLAVVGCKKTPPDGSYCAKVMYQNTNNKQSSYTLIVEIKDNHLIDISFPEEHYDQSEIKPLEVPKDGKLTAVSQSGSIYKVEMIGQAEKCIKATNMVQCKGKSKDGNRCKRYTSNKDGFCWQHKSK